MTSFVARLRHAPYPYDGSFADERRPFFDTTENGQRAHTTVRDTVFAERPHYSDDRVLFHIPPHFDAGQPFDIVVFFHGHNAELRRTVLGELKIAHQLDLSRRNALLIAPQLARDAADSAPGKLFRRNGFKRMLDEATTVLARRAKIPPQRLRRAPIILAAYSGGYRATAYTLDRGGVTSRVAGVVLLDALYGEEDKLFAWMRQERGFVFALGGPSTERGHRALQRRLCAAGCTVGAALSGPPAPGALIFKMTGTSHAQLPLIGPPNWPLATVLAPKIRKK